MSWSIATLLLLCSAAFRLMFISSSEFNTPSGYVQFYKFNPNSNQTKQKNGFCADFFLEKAREEAGQMNKTTKKRFETYLSIELSRNQKSGRFCISFELWIYVWRNA
ncbi:uncharacterized protein MELLADRAFT_62183 [Melampsora larici-populina 98AG31]|uniref:Secreted protein n=1 Tax=Melampsora larici-populina (strain 98AG31 / pathotype 3-4-7) TaxID=747676 RepID=F4RHX0_MELLP|nr:uncharacterized protein MELLADRAFT_62183 [Melampsora larici-populina 98AG31]EGG07897.1 hypothetical protein MELLADRAFT_62183 [Melampsora larici-populina 98AG31]